MSSTENKINADDRSIREVMHPQRLDAKKENKGWYHDGR